MSKPALQRYSSSAAASVLVTAALLYVMQAMIATGTDPIVSAKEWLLPTLVRIRDPIAPRKRERVEPFEPPIPPPPSPSITPSDQDGTTVIRHVRPPAPRENPRVGVQGELTGAPIALVKVSANYPPRAIVRGLEGYVIVEFTVTSAGSVADVRVVESSHAIFEAHAIAAAQKFRYRPRIVGGEPVSTPGVLNRFTFTLEN